MEDSRSPPASRRSRTRRSSLSSTSRSPPESRRSARPDAATPGRASKAAPTRREPSPSDTRAGRDSLLLVRSVYRQPFGTFSGELPGGVALAEGYGVMEEHEAWW